MIDIGIYSLLKHRFIMFNTNTFMTCTFSSSERQKVFVDHPVELSKMK